MSRHRKSGDNIPFYYAVGAVESTELPNPTGNKHRNRNYIRSTSEASRIGVTPMIEDTCGQNTPDRQDDLSTEFQARIDG